MKPCRILLQAVHRRNFLAGVSTLPCRAQAGLDFRGQELARRVWPCANSLAGMAAVSDDVKAPSANDESLDVQPYSRLEERNFQNLRRLHVDDVPLKRRLQCVSAESLSLT